MKKKSGILLFFACLLFSVQSLFAASGTTPTIVRVGYFENELFQEGAAEGRIKKGYAYEYYQKISEYAGWKYEYVYGSFPELYAKLEQGDIDLLAGLAYTPERAERIFYQAAPMGTTRYYLLKKNTTWDITTEPSSLNGKRIGVQESYMVQMLESWLQENNVTAAVTICEYVSDLFTAFDKRELDCVVVEGSGTYGRSDIDAFICIGSENYYVGVSRNRQDLLKDLNLAYSQLSVDNPSFITQLYAKYFYQSLTSSTFTASELNYISSHTNITIGYLNNYLPYCNTTTDGSLTGFLPHLMAEAMARLNLTDRTTVHYRGYDSVAELIAALHDETIDAAFPVGGGLFFAEENDFYQSQAVVNSSVGLVYKGTYEKNRVPVFAVNKNNDMQYHFVKTNFPDAGIVFYDSVEECLDAVLKQEADYTNINGLRVTQLLKNTRYRTLSYRVLPQSDERCFGVKIGNEALLHLLNKGINSLGEEYILNMAYQYTESLFHYTFSDYLKNVLYVLIPLLFVVGIIITAYSLQTKRKLASLNKELQNSLASRERFITDMIRYASSEADADKILNQLVEYIGKNSEADRVYVFEENNAHCFDNTYEWCKPGITAEKDNLQNIPYEGVIEVWIDEFKKHSQVVVEDIDAYESVSKEIYDILKPQNIQTLVAVPVAIRGKICGFIGVDNPPEKDISHVADFLNLVEFFFSLMIRLRNGMTILQESAVHDQLTGCKNRKALIWAYNDEFNPEESVAVVAVDLNGLKQINDNQGHEAGDKFITRMADALCDVFGKDNVYRMGGDEFTVVVTGKTREEFDTMMNSYQVLTGTTASVGYVFREQKDESFAEMMKQADFEMYRAKDSFYQNQRRSR